MLMSTDPQGNEVNICWPLFLLGSVKGVENGRNHTNVSSALDMNSSQLQRKIIKEQ